MTETYYDLKLRNLSEKLMMKIQQAFLNGKLYQSSRPVKIELTQIPQGQAPDLWDMEIFHLPPKQEALAHTLLLPIGVEDPKQYPVIKETSFLGNIIKRSRK